MERAELDEVVAGANRLRHAPGGGSGPAWRALWARVALDAAVPPGTAADALDALLGHPSRRLAAYGTLRPGGPNHHLVAGLGPWRPGWVRGCLGSWEGYPLLRPGPDRVPVMVLHSDALGAHLSRLDDFEGPAYRRDWVVVDHGDDAGAPAGADLQVAQCYVAR